MIWNISLISAVGPDSLVQGCNMDSLSFNQNRITVMAMERFLYGLGL